MTQEEIYLRWRQTKQQVDVSTNFANRVMERIEPAPLHSVPRGLLHGRLIERIDLSVWAKVATIALASLVGLGRILLTLHNAETSN